MPVYVAFLRGINVGRNNQVSMADLKRVVDGPGPADVRTHLRSGNVVFSAKAGDGATLEAALERALDTELPRWPPRPEPASGVSDEDRRP